MLKIALHKDRYELSVLCILNSMSPNITSDAHMKYITSKKTHLEILTHNLHKHLVLNMIQEQTTKSCFTMESQVFIKCKKTMSKPHLLMPIFGKLPSYTWWNVYQPIDSISSTIKSSNNFLDHSQSFCTSIWIIGSIKYASIYSSVKTFE